MLNSIKMKLKRNGTSPSATTGTTTTPSTSTVPSGSTAPSSSHAGTGDTSSSSPSASTAIHHNHALSASATAAVLDGSLPRADLGLPTSSSHSNSNKTRRRSSVSRDTVNTFGTANGNGSGTNGGAGAFNSGSSNSQSNVSSTLPSNSLLHTLAAEAAAAHAQAIAAVAIDLPVLSDTPLAKRENLFKQKLTQCSVIDLNWDDPEADKKAKECKRLALIELVDYINTPGGQKILTETMYQDIINMISINVFRALPSSSSSGSSNSEEVSTGGGEGGGEDDEPFIEPAWVHLQLVYEFLLRFVVSSEVKVKAAKKQIDTVFCSKLIELFESEDPRERDYLKTILHRIYGKFLSHRSFIRKAISHVFFRFVYETDRHNGIGELLEILGSIINGFALPLKEEHVQFLERALIPLHRPKSISTYFQQLSFCMVQYIEKDPTTVANIIRGIMRSWPWSSSSKQILLLNEIEELLEIAGPESVTPIMPDLFRLLARCVGSSHFQVAERALFLWNNEVLITTGVLSHAYASQAIPELCEPLCKQANGHWNPTVESLAKNVVHHYEEADHVLFERVRAGTAKAIEDRQKDIQLRKQRWQQLEAEAKKMVALSVSNTTDNVISSSSTSSSFSTTSTVSTIRSTNNNNSGVNKSLGTSNRSIKSEQKTEENEDEEKETD